MDGGRWLASVGPAGAAAFVRGLSGEDAAGLATNWRFWARPEQVAPPGEWAQWLVLAGRGFGKTRAGAEWVREVALGLDDDAGLKPPPADPARPCADVRIALVGATLAEARAVMVEGPSGLLAIGAADERPRFEPSLRRLTWPTGAVAHLYGAAEPEALRGAQHSHGWCDELGKWGPGGVAALDNLLLGLRLGERARLVLTTTPRAGPVMERVLALPGTVVTRGRMADNALNLSAPFAGQMRAIYGDTRLGRQELDGELLSDLEGALWTRAMLEDARVAPPPRAALVRVVVGVDPSVHGGGAENGTGGTGGDACGIVVVGRDGAGVDHVLEDASLEGAAPERWAQGVAAAAARWAADRVVAEANNGGALVGAVLRAADAGLPLALVHAAHGKAARAEPVALRTATGRLRLAGAFPALEDELCGLLAGGRYAGPGRSPDRADAMVWAAAALMEADGAVPARVRVLG